MFPGSRTALPALPLVLAGKRRQQGENMDSKARILCIIHVHVHVYTLELVHVYTYKTALKEGLQLTVCVLAGVCRFLGLPLAKEAKSLVFLGRGDRGGEGGASRGGTRGRSWRATLLLWTALTACAERKYIVITRCKTPLL